MKVAMRYLKSMNLKFQNWELAVLAYNAGERRLEKGIKKLGTKNAWKLLNAGFGGDDGYLARITAAIILMKSPKLLE